MSTIYLIRKRQLGDVLWIDPIIRKLSSKYSNIIVHTKYNELFSSMNYQNVIFKNNLNLFERFFSKIEKLLNTRFRFINLDDSYENHPKIHLLHAYQKKANLPFEITYPIFNNFDINIKNKLNISGKFFILHIESFSEKNYRNVYGVDWSIITNYINDIGYKVIQVGVSPTEIKNTIKVSTTIYELISLIKEASYFIGIDSFPSHVAASIKVPSIIFFGAVNPEFRHFKCSFNGFLLSQHCEFAGCYHESKSKKLVSCKIVGDSGIPKCSMHSNEYVKKYIDDLLQLNTKL
jgi:ADP-heptose:LPS heptosyltransferase